MRKRFKWDGFRKYKQVKCDSCGMSGVCRECYAKRLAWEKAERDRVGPTVSVGRCFTSSHTMGEKC